MKTWEDYQRIKVSGYEEVLEVMLSNPEKRNVLDEQMIKELRTFFSNEENFHGFRLVYIKGEGKVFCAGGNLRWMEEKGSLPYEENLKDAVELGEMYEAIWRCPVPVCCEVRGGAWGGGLGFLAVSDIVIAEENAKFRLPEVKIGLVPAVVSVFLEMKIGSGNLWFLALSGKEIGVEEAMRIGLVNISAKEEELEKKKEEVIREILSSSPYALRRTKELTRTLTEIHSIKAKIKIASEYIAQARASEEGKEGIRSFFEKRKPRWNKIK